MSETSTCIVILIRWKYSILRFGLFNVSKKKNRKRKHKIGAYLKQIIIDIVIALVVLLQRKRVFTTNEFEPRFQS